MSILSKSNEPDDRWNVIGETLTPRTCFQNFLGRLEALKADEPTHLAVSCLPYLGSQIGQKKPGYLMAKIWVHGAEAQARPARAHRRLADHSAIYTLAGADGGRRGSRM